MTQQAINALDKVIASAGALKAELANSPLKKAIAGAKLATFGTDAARAIAQAGLDIGENEN